VLLGGGVSTIGAFAATFATIGSVILANSDLSINLEGLLLVDASAQLVGNNFEAASVSSGGTIDLDVGVELFAGGSEDGGFSGVEVKFAVLVAVVDDSSVLQLRASAWQVVASTSNDGLAITVTTVFTFSFHSC
jgi:hypothetical protein